MNKNLFLISYHQQCIFQFFFSLLEYKKALTWFYNAVHPIFLPLASVLESTAIARPSPVYKQYCPAFHDTIILPNRQGSLQRQRVCSSSCPVLSRQENYVIDSGFCLAIFLSSLESRCDSSCVTKKFIKSCRFSKLFSCSFHPILTVFNIKNNNCCVWHN